MWPEFSGIQSITLDILCVVAVNDSIDDWVGDCRSWLDYGGTAYYKERLYKMD
jgi:hypothetical protein